MSNTTTFDQPRLAYRSAVVDLFRKGAEPEIQRAALDIANMQAEVNRLAGKIGDAEKYIAELRQALKDVEAQADLPAPQMPLQTPQGNPREHVDAFGGPHTGTLLPQICGCGEPMENDPKLGLIHRDDSGWEAAGDGCHRSKTGTKILPPVGKAS